MVVAADLVVASSGQLLRGRPGPCAGPPSSGTPANTIIRPDDDPADAAGRRRRIGYYGAIAEWFDSELVAELAGLAAELALRADRFDPGGERAAARGSCPMSGCWANAPMPSCRGRIGDWDAFIIPFSRVPLTEATNPVKVYEMLATGKPVVAVGLPELVPIAEQGLIRLGDTAEEFARAIESELRNANPELTEHRRAFARANTWNARYVELERFTNALRTPRRGHDSSETARGPCG